MARVSKTASPSMKIYTGTPTLAKIGKSSVSLLYDWFPVAKNEEVFNKFYQRSWKNPLKALTFVQKDKFVQLQIIYFPIPCRDGVFVQIFILGLCEITKFKIFGHPRLNIIFKKFVLILSRGLAIISI